VIVTLAWKYGWRGCAAWLCKMDSTSNQKLVADSNIAACRWYNTSVDLSINTHTQHPIHGHYSHHVHCYCFQRVAWFVMRLVCIPLKWHPTRMKKSLSSHSTKIWSVCELYIAKTNGFKLYSKCVQSYLLTKWDYNIMLLTNKGFFSGEDFFSKGRGRGTEANVNVVHNAFMHYE